MAKNGPDTPAGGTPPTLTLERLARAVRDDAALVRVRRLQPIGGPGDKLFPPTYPGKARTDPSRHAFEERRIPGRPEPVRCVLLDSVQSQANRMEEALERAIGDGRAEIPHLFVDFEPVNELSDVGRISSLRAPHRAFDAILRDSLLGDKPFPQSDVGQALTRARPTDATALLNYDPVSLVLGVWNSTGEGGGLGAKFPRIVVSEITGIDAVEGRRVGSRVDPLGIRAGIKVLADEDRGWGFEKKEVGAKAKEVRPSEVNHGNIAPSITELGVTIDYAEHRWTLTFAGLRRLQFGGRKPEPARLYLAALAVLAGDELERAGHDLRSRCSLVPEPDQGAGWELVRTDGAREAVTLGDTAALLRAAAAGLAAAGFTSLPEPIRLQPQPKLIELVRRSRELALRGRGEAAADDKG